MSELSLIGETVRFAKFPARIVEVLASTQTVKLYLAKDPENRTVLIKYLSLPQNELCFRRELNAYKKIGSHPKIVTQFDYLEENNIWGAFLLEYCNGGDLKSFMNEDEITEQQIITILRDIAMALNHIHQKKISHRALRPECIFITTDFKFKLGDFSSAISEEEMSGLYGAALSDDIEAHTKGEYRAPEQLDLTPGYPLGTQVDMWGLGCLIYELLFHQSAFNPSNQLDQLRGKYRTPNKPIAGWWRALLARLFEVNPRERATTQEILQMIQDNTVTKPLYSEGQETPKGSASLSSFFMKSSNSWVKAITSDGDSPPDSQFLNKLIGKAWNKPFKISKFFKSLMQRPVEKTTVALKCLLVLHKYMFGGPKQVFTQEIGPNQFLETLQHTWASPTKSKKDKFANEYFRGLIGHYSNVLKEKSKLHLETRTCGNWTENDTLDIPSIESLLTYWYKLIQVSNTLFMGVDELSKIRSAIAALLLEEQERLDSLIWQGIRTLQPGNQVNEITSKYYQHQQWTASLITSFRQRHSIVTINQVPNTNETEIEKTLIFDAKKQRRQTQLHPLPTKERSFEIEISHTAETKVTNCDDPNTPGSKSANYSNDTSPIYVEENLNKMSITSPDVPRTIIEEESPPHKPIQNLLIEKAPKKNLWESLQDSPWLIKPDEIVPEEEIGVGSSCTVYKGLYRHTPVAIKVMRKSNIEGAMENEFNRELTTLMRMRHPNLVLFMGACIENQLCIVTEFCAGGSLFKLLYENREVKLSWKQRIKIAKDVAQGMAFLHSSNPPIIYRDLKSLNLLLSEPVTTQNDHILVKIADFGIAKFVSDEHMTGQMGTCHWMAPEVLGSQPYTLAADVYSYGIVLWEILSRETPYRGVNPVVIPYKVMQLGERPDLNKIPPTTPIELRDLITQCWAQDPETRPTFSGILQALNSISI